MAELNKEHFDKGFKLQDGTEIAYIYDDEELSLFEGAMAGVSNLYPMEELAIVICSPKPLSKFQLMYIHRYLSENPEIDSRLKLKELELYSRDI
jgi:hypothetical protein